MLYTSRDHKNDPGTISKRNIMLTLLLFCEFLKQGDYIIPHLQAQGVNFINKTH